MLKLYKIYYKLLVTMRKFVNNDNKMLTAIIRYGKINLLAVKK